MKIKDAEPLWTKWAVGGVAAAEESYIKSIRRAMDVLACQDDSLPSISLGIAGTCHSQGEVFSAQLEAEKYENERFMGEHDEGDDWAHDEEE